jgi:small subunit ribosomal protein S19
MAKELTYKGKTKEDLDKMNVQDFAKLVPSRHKRTMLRGFTDAQKILLKKINAVNAGKYKKNIKTHCREMVILPEMVGLTIYIHNGKVFMPVSIVFEMLGHRLGEFVDTRTRLKHSAPGIGATRSSSSQSVK